MQSILIFAGQSLVNNHSPSTTHACLATNFHTLGVDTLCSTNYANFLLPQKQQKELVHLTVTHIFKLVTLC